MFLLDVVVYFLMCAGFLVIRVYFLLASLFCMRAIRQIHSFISQ